MGTSIVFDHVLDMLVYFFVLVVCVAWVALSCIDDCHDVSLKWVRYQKQVAAGQVNINIANIPWCALLFGNMWSTHTWGYFLTGLVDDCCRGRRRRVRVGKAEQRVTTVKMHPHCCWPTLHFHPLQIHIKVQRYLQLQIHMCIQIQVGHGSKEWR